MFFKAASVVLIAFSAPSLVLTSIDVKTLAVLIVVIAATPVAPKPRKVFAATVFVFVIAVSLVKVILPPVVPFASPEMAALSVPAIVISLPSFDVRTIFPPSLLAVTPDSLEIALIAFLNALSLSFADTPTNPISLPLIVNPPAANEPPTTFTVGTVASAVVVSAVAVTPVPLEMALISLAIAQAEPA